MPRRVRLMLRVIGPIALLSLVVLSCTESAKGSTRPLPEPKSTCLAEDGRPGCSVLRQRLWEGHHPTWRDSGQLRDWDDDGRLTPEDSRLAAIIMRLEAYDWQTWKNAVARENWCADRFKRDWNDFIASICKGDQTAFAKLREQYKKLIDAAAIVCAALVKDWRTRLACVVYEVVFG
jgi:hypothetical protein